MRLTQSMALIKRIHPHHGYPLLVFSWAALAYGVAPLLDIGTLLAQSFAGVAVGLGGITTVVGLMHMWRYG